MYSIPNKKKVKTCFLFNLILKVIITYPGHLDKAANLACLAMRAQERMPHCVTVYRPPRDDISTTA